MTRGWYVSDRTENAGRLMTLTAIALVGTLALAGCGDGQREAPPPENVTDAVPLNGLSPDLKAAFVRGAVEFQRTFTVPDGLGPLFNQPGCSSCHPGNGRGTPSTNLTRFSRRGDLVPHLGGGQLQDRGIPGVPPERLPLDVETSVRMPPQIFGAGLIEAIPEKSLLALADPDDTDSDGISGRVNMVQPAGFVPPGAVGAGTGPVVGRFGLKSNVSSLLEQIVNAYREDIGITSNFLPDEVLHPQANGGTIGDIVPDPEILASVVQDVVMYVRLLAPPGRGEITEEVRRGEALFKQIGCASCHVPTLKTGPSPIPALNEVEVNLYSDLLLHDVGYFLEDGTGAGSEWRTPPLWGLRLAGDAHGGTPFYLHDGRTSDLREAIWTHLGEATNTRNRFLALSADKQEALMAFLMSL